MNVRERAKERVRQSEGATRRAQEVVGAQGDRGKEKRWEDGL